MIIGELELLVGDIVGTSDSELVDIFVVDTVSTMRDFLLLDSLIIGSVTILSEFDKVDDCVIDSVVSESIPPLEDVVPSECWYIGPRCDLIVFVEPLVN